MRDHILSILRDSRNAMGKDAEVTDKILTSIEARAMAALQGGKVIVPSKLFGDIDIPQNVITEMSNGENNQWFSHRGVLDINISYIRGWWVFEIHPIKNGDNNTDRIIEKGRL